MYVFQRGQLTHLFRHRKSIKPKTIINSLPNKGGVHETNTRKMKNKIDKLHRQLEELYTEQGVETFVSVKLPTGDHYNIAVARASTLKEIKKSINEKI